MIVNDLQGRRFHKFYALKPANPEENFRAMHELAARDREAGKWRSEVTHLRDGSVAFVSTSPME